MMRVVLLTCIVFVASAAPLQAVVGILKKESGNLKEEDKSESSTFEEEIESLEVQETRLRNTRKRQGEKIAEAEAAIVEADGVIQAGSSKAEEATKEVARLEDEIKTHVANYADKLKVIDATIADSQDSIDVMKRAIRVIKKGMSGGFLQGTFKHAVDEVVSTLTPLLAAQRINFMQPEQLTALVQSAQDSTFDQPEAENYQNKSGGIVAQLSDMLANAEAKLEEMLKARMETKFAGDMAKNTMDNKIKAHNQEIETSNNDVAEATQNKGEASKNLAAAKAALAAAETEFSAVVKTEKEDTKEHKVFQEDNSAMQSGVDGGLDSLQKATLIQEPVSFIQEEPVRAEVSSMLRKLAQRYRSVPIAQIAIRAKNDPFAKVKGLIRELIKKIKTTKEKDAEEHGYCQKEQSANKAKLKKIDNEIAKNSGRMAKEKGKVSAGERSLKDLADAAAGANEAIATAQKVRVESAAENKKIVDTAANNISAMAGALEKIPTSAQMPRNIIGDLKAETEKKKSDTETREANQAAGLDDQKQAHKVAMATNSAESKGAERAIAAAKARIEELSGDLGDLDTARKSEAAVEAGLAKRCTKKTMSFEERAARRQAEIDGLKEALKILTEEAA